MTVLRIFSSVCLLTNLFAISRMQAQGNAPGVIHAAVSEQQLGPLRGNIHPLARAEFDQGLAPSSLPMQRMLLVLKRSPAQQAALLKFLDEQQQAGSANYHRWLTPEQYGERFGLAGSDIAQVTTWLESHGLTIDNVSNGRTVIEFSGTAALVEGAFHTAMHKFTVNGKDHWANTSDPQVPAALLPAIAGISSLHNFFATPQVYVSDTKVTPQIQPGSPQPLATSGTLHHLAPADFAVIYNTNPLLAAGINGTGTVIGVVGRSNIIAQDVVSFRSLFGLPANPPNIILNGSDPGDLGGVEEIEAVLDTSWSGAVAPGAQIDLVVSASTATTDGVTLSEEYIIDQNLANVMTESFGDCEANYTGAGAAVISSMAQQAAAQGITYLVSTGDSGSAGCDAVGSGFATGPLSVNMLASTPYNVAVGGTQFNEGSSSVFWNSSDSSNYGSALSYIPEDVWNYNCIGAICDPQGMLIATGGGVSIFFSKPSWQTGVPGIPSDGQRDLPDVSLTASNHDAYLLCIEGSCTSKASGIAFLSVYGTSASTPSFAGIMALVNQKTGTRQGQANPTLYGLAAAQNWAACNSSNTPNLPPSNCVFQDITVGTNAVPGQAGYGTPTQTYSATLGYDLGSGLGSVNATALVNAWATGPLSTNPTPPFSVSPASGSGVTQALTFTFSNAAGAANIWQGHMLVTGNGTGNNACYLIYQASNNGLYLVSDGGSSLSDPVTPGGSGTLANGQCSVAAASVSVTSSGNTLTITESPLFTPAFAGSKVVMMYTFDTANVGSGWSSVGTWTVPSVTTAPAFSVSPASGSGATQVFSFTFSNAGGAGNISQGHMLVTGNGTGNNACYLIYQSANNGLYLTSDDGASLRGPVTPGNAGMLSNSQCSVAAASVSILPSGNTLVITETSVFAASFAGNKTSMTYTFDASNLGSGWFTVGTWTVPGAVPAAPFVISNTPGSGLM